MDTHTHTRRPLYNKAITIKAVRAGVLSITAEKLHLTHPTRHGVTLQTHAHAPPVTPPTLHAHVPLALSACARCYPCSRVSYPHQESTGRGRRCTLKRTFEVQKDGGRQERRRPPLGWRNTRGGSDKVRRLRGNGGQGT